MFLFLSSIYLVDGFRGYPQPLGTSVLEGFVGLVILCTFYVDLGGTSMAEFFVIFRPHSGQKFRA